MAISTKRKFKVLNVDDAINILRWQIKDNENAEKEREEAYKRHAASSAAADEIAERIDMRIRGVYDDIKDTIRRNFVLHPQHHERCFGIFEGFYNDFSYEISIFIMTKFPDADDAEKDYRLEKVIACVKECITDCGYAPRIARGSSRYHDALWDNVELHLIGCSRGIAIVEDKSKRETNLNVAMEWGFMRALGKPVLYLEEKDFSHHKQIGPAFCRISSPG